MINLCRPRHCLLLILFGLGLAGWPGEAAAENPSDYTFKRIKILRGDHWTGDVRFSPEGDLLAFRDFEFYSIRNAASESYDSVVWEYRGGKSFVSNFSRLSDFSPDGDYFAFVPFPKKENIALLRLADQEYVANVTTGADEVVTLCFGPGGRLASAGEDGTIEIRRLDNGNLSDPRSFYSHGEKVYTLAFDPDGSLLASGGKDGTVRIWQGDGGRFPKGQVLRGHGRPVFCAAFSPDGEHLASGGEDRKVRIWRSAGNRFSQVQALDHADTVFALDFTPDGRYLATAGGDAVIRIWEMTGDRFRLADTLTDHKKWINSLAFSPDGRYLASGGKDRVVVVWRRTERLD